MAMFEAQGAVDWWTDQISPATKLFGLPETEEARARMLPVQKLDAEFIANAGLYKLWSYACMGFFVLTFLVQVLILCLFWRFYKTGQDVAEIEKADKAKNGGNSIN